MIGEIIAIVPAAGIGIRMSYNIPKQYIIIGKKTIIEHTINTLLLHPKIKKVIVVLNKHDIFFKNLSLYKNKRIITVIGGKTRTQSVFLGIKEAIKIKIATWVIIHDAVRPFINIEDISRLLSIIKKSSIGGITAVPVKDTIKYSKKNIIQYTINRNYLWIALTPQLFPINLLFNCIRKTINNNFFITDESSALEYCGHYPKIVIGKNYNIKITNKDDLKFAKIFISQFK